MSGDDGRRCVHCGADISHRRWNAKYCHDEHREAHYRWNAHIESAALVIARLDDVERSVCASSIRAVTFDYPDMGHDRWAQVLLVASEIAHHAEHSGLSVAEHWAAVSLALSAARSVESSPDSSASEGLRAAFDVAWSALVADGGGSST